ncbi:hypothetical protein NG831_03225 [Xanthomonas sacchari]|nr:hypothetical protein [Xanthomonas sacchari]UYK67228.1 hypothetical protein NG831_03225 [Xanthomonas sacchari]
MGELFEQRFGGEAHAVAVSAMQCAQRVMLHGGDTGGTQQFAIVAQRRQQAPFVAQAQIEQALGQVARVGAAHELRMQLRQRAQAPADMAAGIVAVGVDRQQAVEGVLVQVEGGHRIALPRLFEQGIERAQTLGVGDAVAVVHEALASEQRRYRLAPVLRRRTGQLCLAEQPLAQRRVVLGGLQQQRLQGLRCLFGQPLPQSSPGVFRRRCALARRGVATCRARPDQGGCHLVLAELLLHADRTVAFPVQAAVAPVQAHRVDLATGDLGLHGARGCGEQGHAAVLGVGEAAFVIASFGDRQQHAPIDLYGREDGRHRGILERCAGHEAPALCPQPADTRQWSADVRRLAASRNYKKTYAAVLSVLPISPCQRSSVASCRIRPRSCTRSPMKPRTWRRSRCCRSSPRSPALPASPLRPATSRWLAA